MYGMGFQHVMCAGQGDQGLAVLHGDVREMIPDLGAEGPRCVWCARD